MATHSNINDILTQVKKLNKKEQFNLLQQLISILKETQRPENDTVRLSLLAGLGNEIWKGTNPIDHYIDEERQW